MKRLTIAVAVVGVLCACFIVSRASSQEQRRQERLRAFMRLKLTSAQSVLEGVALGDYDKIAAHAQKLSLMSLESNWKVIQTPEYLDHSGDFRDAADRLIKAAKKKNIDGATLAYVELTLRCVHCHKYVRAKQ